MRKAAMALSGCTFLPAAGPTARAIEAGAEVATADGGLLARYAIVDVTPAVVEALRGRPLDSLLASFGDHRPSAEPVIGIGDMVSVSVWEAGSGGLFSGPLVADRFSAGSKSALIPEQPVGRDGAISVPYAVTRPISQAVTVAGEGAAGARLPLSGHGDRILDVIASAGGNRSPVSETFVRLSRGPLTATVPLTTVVSNPRENIYLRPNDVLTLVRDPQTFLAVGAVGQATELPFSAAGITLAQALAKARGLSAFQAAPAGPFVFRFDMRDPNSLFTTQAFRMRNRDLVYVSNAPFTEVQKVLGVLSSVTSPVSSAALAYSYAR